MSKARVISFVLESDFGFLRKPETNEGIQLSFNMLHKPALLGILGAILGLEGYREKDKWPEYYLRLKNLKLGIAPQIGRHERGNFSRTVLTYNNGVGYASQEKGGNLLITENTLISPAYEVFLLLEESNALHQSLGEALAKGEAHFIPYLGKNEHYAWWDKASVKWFDAQPVTPSSQALVIDSLFYKDSAVSGGRASQAGFFLDSLGSDDFLYFERLPVGFNEKLQQYDYADFAYSNCQWKLDGGIASLYAIKGDSGEKRVQLF